MLARSLLAAATFALFARASQVPLPTNECVSESSTRSQYWELPHEIKRVAVIGAGANGLMQTAALLKQGFEVRMFERAPQPGGVWLYSEKTAVPPPFVRTPNNISAYTPDIPEELPSSKVYNDGDDGLTLDWRVREQWNPSAAWNDMQATVLPDVMRLPGISYPADLPWKMKRSDVQRHVRQYATSVGLSSNDEEHLQSISYFTRVERLIKVNSKWHLTLRKMTPLDGGRLKVEWWTEVFDAVVVAAEGEGDAAHVPIIPGLATWAERFPERIFHSRDYRRPEEFADKNVLIVGAFVSGMGISKELAKVAASVSISARPTDNFIYKMIRAKFPSNVEWIPEIVSVESKAGSFDNETSSVQDASLLLANGTAIGGFDYIIFATGFRTSFPWLIGFHNETIKGFEQPETGVAPIITDGTHLRSLHWTGHYIDDPTLVFTRHEPWNVGEYSALGNARVWAGKARLPSIERMWGMYPGAGYSVDPIPGVSQKWIRLFVTWLNDAALEFGGRLVAPPTVEKRQAFSYFIAQEYTPFLWLADTIEEEENTPRGEWDSYNDTQPLTFVESRTWASGSEVEERKNRDVWDRLADECRGMAGRVGAVRLRW